jgi:hypothetical protein
MLRRSFEISFIEQGPHSRVTCWRLSSRVGINLVKVLPGML